MRIVFLAVDDEFAGSMQRYVYQAHPEWVVGSVISTCSIYKRSPLGAVLFVLKRSGMRYGFEMFKMKVIRRVTGKRERSTPCRLARDHKTEVFYSRNINDAASLERLAAFSRDQGWVVEQELSVDDWPLVQAAEHLLKRLAELKERNPGRTVAMLTGGELSSPVTGDGVGDLAATAAFEQPLPFGRGVVVVHGLTGSTAHVIVSAVPVSPPVVIAPGGGSFDFTVTLTNTTAQPQSVQAWTAVTGPAARERSRQEEEGPRPRRLTGSREKANSFHSLIATSRRSTRRRCCRNWR